jgi:adenylate kinase
MGNRLIERGKSSGRIDDNEETIKLRLKIFHEVTQPVVDFYKEKNKLQSVDVSSLATPNEVFSDVEKIFDKVLGESKNDKKNCLIL